MLREKIKAELTSRNWSVQRLSEETGLRYASLTEFLNGKKGISGKYLETIIKLFSDTQINYKIEFNLLSDDADINLIILDGFGFTTQYSPIIFAVYKLEEKIIYYTESKTGDLKHAYSISEKRLIDISEIENLDPVYGIGDQRF